MITLCMDTSHRFLVLALYDEDHLLASIEEEIPKRQSEEIFPKLNEVMAKANKKPMDIDQIVISKGPGSYTGVRIAMSIAKVICALRKIPLYTISTLQLYAGNEDCRVVLDARGGRVYTACYKDTKEIESASVKEIDEIDIGDMALVGDGSLFGKEDNYPSIAKNFILAKDAWELAENVHLVVPEYLKSIDAYKVTK